MNDDFLTALKILLLGHWVFDFVFQTREQAENKHHSFAALGSHVTFYSVGMTFVFFMVSNFTSYEWQGALLFYLFIWISHIVTDFITSRMSHDAYKAGNMKAFWNVIGADQCLHILQIITILEITTHNL